MVFKTRKIPRHLIIEDEFEFNEKPKRGIFQKLLLWSVFLMLGCFLTLVLLCRYKKTGLRPVFSVGQYYSSPS